MSGCLGFRRREVGGYGRGRVWCLVLVLQYFEDLCSSQGFDRRKPGCTLMSFEQ